MKVLVCGGRDFKDAKAVYSFLDAHHAKEPITLIISGGARGADSLGVAWAVMRGIKKKVVPADWRQHGLRAGLRNQKMLDEEKPDLVIAFPGGRGTADMVYRAESRGVPVDVFSPMDFLIRERS